MNNPFETRGRFRNPLIAALETCADRRLNRGGDHNAGANGNASGLNPIDRAVALIEAASAKIEANDFSAVEALFAGQALALDAMFDKLARETTFEDLRLALRAQSQCRHTFKTLMALKTPREIQNSNKRTIAQAESPA